MASRPNAPQQNLAYPINVLSHPEEWEIVEEESTVTPQNQSMATADPEEDEGADPLPVPTFQRSATLGLNQRHPTAEENSRVILMPPSDAPPPALATSNSPQAALPPSYDSNSVPARSGSCPSLLCYCCPWWIKI